MEPQWLLLLLWTCLLGFSQGALQFVCDSGYFDITENVETLPTELKKSTNATGIGNWFRCIPACVMQQSCRSVVYDSSIDLCYFTDAVLNCSTKNTATNAGYQCAVLNNACSDIVNCSQWQPCSSTAASRDTFTGCTDARNRENAQSGPYYVDPDGLGSFLLWCDFIGNESWAVVQRRLDGSTDFYRGWSDYKNGFGDVTKEYWLGLDKLYRLTRASTPKLNIVLEDFNGNARHANYSTMSITNESSLYTLTLGDYAGDAGDSMGNGSIQSSSGMKFSTYDRDNDVQANSTVNCAQRYQGAWWYRGCFEANLNGMYLHGNHTTLGNGVEWKKWTGLYYSLKTSVMRIFV